MEDDGIAPLASYGSEYILRLSGTTHDETGFPSSKPENADKFVRHYTDKIEKNKKNIVIVRKYNIEDADYAIITFGCSTRPAQEAMEILREEGKKVGILQLVTLWPFPEEEIAEICSKVKGIIVPELNLGQLIGEVNRVNTSSIPILGVNKVNGLSINPYEIVDKFREAEKCLE